MQIEAVDVFSLPFSLRKIGGDIQTTLPGVYMCLVFDPSAQSKYFLYVGQATELKTRLRDHQSAAHRANCPSLHYYVRDQPDMVEEYVVLAETLPDTDNLPLFLNLLEMLGTLLFQTLPEKTLRRYLPPNTPICCPGIHLNVASPLSQGVRDGSKSFALLFYSDEPMIKAYIEAYLVRKSATMRLRALEGIDRPREMKLGRSVADERSNSDKRAYVYLRQVYFHLNDKMLKQIGATYDERVMVDFELSETDPHPTPYATRSGPNDPAIRLGVRVTGPEGEVFLSSGGNQIVKRVNTLVDEIEGRTAEEIENTPNRMLRLTKRQPMVRYT